MGHAEDFDQNLWLNHNHLRGVGVAKQDTPSIAWMSKPTLLVLLLSGPSMPWFQQEASWPGHVPAVHESLEGALRAYGSSAQEWRCARGQVWPKYCPSASTSGGMSSRFVPTWMNEFEEARPRGGQ